MDVIALIILLSLSLALYGYIGRYAVTRGYRAGEAGGFVTLALPFYLKAAPYFLIAGLLVSGGAVIFALVK